MAPVDETTVRGALLEARRRLKAAGIATASLDAEVLVGHVLGSRRELLHAHPERALRSSQRMRLNALIERRLKREPVAYLTGLKEFYGLPLQVDSRVLIPRPETELLVERAIAYLKAHPNRGDVVDLGTGSGAVAIAIASVIPWVRVTATDVDPEALKVASRNVRKFADGRVRMKQGDLLEGIKAADLVVANLPYLSERRRERLSPDVRFEPLGALDGGSDGLRWIERSVVQAKEVIRPGGKLLLECDPEQVGRIRRTVLKTWPAAKLSVHEDLAGLPRLVEVAIP